MTGSCWCRQENNGGRGKNGGLFCFAADGLCHARLSELIVIDEPVMATESEGAVKRSPLDILFSEPHGGELFNRTPPKPVDVTPRRGLTILFRGRKGRRSSTATRLQSR